MTIDEPTLMAVLGLASLTASAMFFTLHFYARQMAGVRTWAMGAVLVGAATSIDAPRLITDWQIASLLFNIPFAVGHALFLIGTIEFVRRPVPRFMVHGLVLTATFLTIAFTLVIPDSVLRISTLSVFQFACNALTAFLLWRFADPAAITAYRTASMVIFVQSLAAMFQAIMVIVSPVTISYAAPELPLANMVTWAGTMSNVLIGNWILFLLIMLRLLGELNTQASRDALTGLLNRRGLRAHIDNIASRPEGLRTLAVVLMDIDHFKTINDSRGHEAGDRALATMGDVLRAHSSPQVTACRWGGEEFCVVTDGFSEAGLIRLAEEIRQSFRTIASKVIALEQNVTVSAGIARMDEVEPAEFSKLVAQADAELYRAKRSGRDRVCIARSTSAETAIEFDI